MAGTILTRMAQIVYSTAAVSSKTDVRAVRAELGPKDVLAMISNRGATTKTTILQTINLTPLIDSSLVIEGCGQVRLLRLVLMQILRRVVLPDLLHLLLETIFNVLSRMVLSRMALSKMVLLSRPRLHQAL
jgi:hypothetical protein